LTPLDAPSVYRTLAGEAPGAVCEVPFGFGGGLSVGVGAQDRRILYYATLHEHPLVGGYIGRMPSDAEERYDATTIAGALARLSDGRAAAAPTAADVAHSPCRYFVVTRATTSGATDAFLKQLPLVFIAGAEGRELYRAR
jgi:hypothetical protein